MNGAGFSNELSAEMRALLLRVEEELGPLADPTLLPAEEGRAQSERSNQRNNVNLPPLAQTRDIIVAANTELGSQDCRMRVLVPHGAGIGAVLFVHGGGFAFCSPETHERCARVLANEIGLPVLVPDYRLAPENPFPAGLHDVVACLRAAFTATAEAGVSRGPLIIAGDSAGANLALAAVMHEERAGRSLPSGMLLFYGAFGADFTTESYGQFAEGPGLTRGKMQRYWNWYCANEDTRRNPLVAPLHADDLVLRALPPLYLLAAGIDPLLSDTLLFADRLKAVGRNDPLTVVPGVTHGFLQNTNELAAAREALLAAGEAARGMIRGS
ncbi:alpha/beta hydrolase [Phyllobacterium zundukense]|jgi:acetyl esterase|uniref:Alpha/beta hydrolase n=1 Tax=Phyllobacterium zundukense TaxID=1867719 RepID=A0ACD4D3L3_9HYPH|nr:alpha/beta hydrolase [Phyllobacterium zundukense]UXN60377.1 alpha/beta hydrolase [Phyllobacterium zundukense]